MSVTAQTIITTALQKLLVVPGGGTPSASQLALGLTDLNDLMRSWRQYGLTNWARRSTTFDLISGKVSYTVGTGGDVDTTRPVAILDAYLTRDESDIPLKKYGKSDYFGLANKTLAGTPTQFWYDQQLTLGVFYPWPVPDEDGLTCTLDTHIPLTDMAVGDSLDIPDEWIEAVKFNLAMRMGPGTGRTVSQDVKELAALTLSEALGGPNSEGASIFLEPW